MTEQTYAVLRLTGESSEVTMAMSCVCGNRQRSLAPNHLYLLALLSVPIQMKEPLEGHVRRVGFHLAVNFYGLMPCGRIEDMLIFRAHRSICKNKTLDLSIKRPTREITLLQLCKNEFSE